MSVCCECCVLSGRGLCVDLITRPTDCGASLCVIQEPQEWGGHGPRWAAAPKNRENCKPKTKLIAINCTWSQRVPLDDPSFSVFLDSRFISRSFVISPLIQLW
jgi:hypothetical protein